VAVRFADGSELTAERLVVATGRRPRVDDVGLDVAGVRVADAGIVVDERCRAADGVWAVGDVTGVAPFTHVASYQGRVAAADMLGRTSRADYRAVPRVVFSDPEIAQAGRDRAQALDDGIDVVTAHADLADTDRTETYGRGLHGGLTVHADRRRAVLVGATAVGPLASEWIHVLALAIKAEVPVDVLLDSMFQFPTFSELVLSAVRGLDL
jgi:dihydrolipoamide dehydrogenase